MFGGEPPCFGTFLAETRSSAGDRRAAQGLRPGQPRHLRPPDIETQVQQNGQNVNSINKGESVVDVATFSGTNGEVEARSNSSSAARTSPPGVLERRHAKVGGTKTIDDESASPTRSRPPSSAGTASVPSTRREDLEYLAG